MPGLGSDWLREEAWLFPTFLRRCNQSANQSWMIGQQVNVLIDACDPTGGYLVESSLTKLLSSRV